MPKEFIEKRIGSASIAEARKQQKQLSYFTQSSIQQDVTSEYLEQWAGRNYSSNDDFLNWVKTIFKTDNFLSFFKYFRNPNAASKLVNDRIKPQLNRVFFSEDSFFKYTLKGQEIETPEELGVKEFNTLIFNAIIFRHNDILITDLKEINTPFRRLISIDNVVAILSHNSIIHKLAYTATVVVEGVKVDGFLYMDDTQYIFYDKELETPLLTVPHDLGECPADYVSNEAFANDDIVRKSMFSYIREEFEEYVFLKTLLKMTEPNGVLPVATVLDHKTKGGGDIKGETNKEPMSANSIGSQRADIGRDVVGVDSLMQAGNVIKVKPRLKDDGSIDVDAVQNFIKFFFIPVESMNYINDRVKDIKANIISTILGDFTEQNQAAKNEKQIAGSFFNKQDRLRGLSMELSRIRERSDFKMLALEHGRDNVTNSAFFGSDFFLESQTELFDLLEKSPNTIERKNLLIRLTKNKNRFNKEKSEREVILYHLLPYVSDKDFIIATESFAVDAVTFQYQSRFNYWIGVFEAQYGDILLFWESNENATNSEKLMLINNLIINIITATVPKPPAPKEGEQS